MTLTHPPELFSVCKLFLGYHSSNLLHNLLSSPSMCMKKKKKEKRKKKEKKKDTSIFVVQYSLWYFLILICSLIIVNGSFRVIPSIIPFCWSMYNRISMQKASLKLSNIFRAKNSSILKAEFYLNRFGNF